MSKSFDSDLLGRRNTSELGDFQSIMDRLHHRMKQDQVVQNTADDPRRFLAIAL